MLKITEIKERENNLEIKRNYKRKKKNMKWCRKRWVKYVIERKGEKKRESERIKKNWQRIIKKKKRERVREIYWSSVSVNPINKILNTKITLIIINPITDLF